MQIAAREPSPKASEFRIHETKDRLVDMAAHQPDIAEFTIVQLPQRFDRRPAIQIRRKPKRPSREPAEKSARRVWHCRLGCGLGHRGHWSSPVAHTAAKLCRRRNRWESAAALFGLIVCTLLSAISGLIGST
jgi:hypothetical protein